MLIVIGKVIPKMSAREFEDSMLACVNTMDFRLGETESWFEKNVLSYVQRFIAEGGYRLYPDMVSLPVSANGGQDVTVGSPLAQYGLGILSY